MWLRNRRWLFVSVVIVIAALLAACGESESPTKVEPALVEEVEGSEFNRVVLAQLSRRT